ncbi:hypothetical protein FXO38_29179 [Capsicum annuum]|nr:hypothetical protein FXO38_29179 [Capsicum annuum]
MEQKLYRKDLARSLNNRLKAGGQFYLIQGMPLAIQVWLYECCSNVPPKIASKVVFKNIEPTKKELSKLQIPQKDAIQHERSVDSDDDFHDPPPRKINEHSKKKQKVDSSTPVAKKPLRKKQVNIFYEHTQTRTPAPCAAKADGMKTPVFKPIQTRQTSSSKIKKGKQTARVIFPQEQVVDIEADIPNVDEEGLGQSRQYFSPDVVQSSDNISNGTKQKHTDKDPDIQNMDYVGTERSPQRLSSEVDQKLKANLLGTKERKSGSLQEGKIRNSKDAFGVETVEDKNWFYMMGFADHTWTDSHIDVCLYYLRKKLKYGPHTVLAEIEKIVKIILLCLQACDFYVKKGIDLQNHSRYKDKEFSDMFDVLFEDDLPQQPSGSLDCGVFMVMYAECISYSHKVIAIEFDPNALRTRYAALLWDYGIQKQEANAISDAKAPLRPARQSRITSVTEVVDV